MFFIPLFAAAAATSVCSPISGFEDALATTRAKWVVAGETHGTNEMPAMFANLVCLASRSAPVIVAVEQPEEDQTAIDTYINSSGGKEAEAAFLHATMWRSGQPDSVLDGRSSQAMFNLFRTLWKLHQQGRVQRVIAFQPSLEFKDGVFRMPWLDHKPIDQVEYEKRMAALIRAGDEDARRVLVLTGSAHARLKPMEQFQTLQPMASFLPRREILTLCLTSTGRGNAWNCTEAGCGVHEIEEATQPRREVILQTDPSQPYSGTLFLGGPLTASLPQRTAQ